MTIDILEPGQKARHGAGTYRDVSPHDYVSMPKTARHHDDLLASVRFAYGQEILREQFSETFVDFTQSGDTHRPARESAAINPTLHFDMCLRFELKVALTRIGTVVVLHCALDV